MSEKVGPYNLPNSAVIGQAEESEEIGQLEESTPEEPENKEGGEE